MEFMNNLVRKRREMERLGDFELPDFFKDPSYFTLQPVGDARQAQIRAWKQLILDYCRSKRIYIVPVEAEFPLFSNPAIERSLSPEATEVFLSALVMEGRAEWTDVHHTECLVLWRSIHDWANYILNFLNERGLESWVCTVEEVRSGDKTRESGQNKFLDYYQRRAVGDASLGNGPLMYLFFSGVLICGPTRWVAHISATSLQRAVRQKICAR